MNGRDRMPVALLAASFLLPLSGVVDAQIAPPGGPNEEASARFTLGDIWNRLATGAAGQKRGTEFSEPAADTATPTMRTTDEIMAVAPAADNVRGATPADVTPGRTFWGLRTNGGTWGLAVGTRGSGGAYPAPVEKTGQVHCYKLEEATWAVDLDCTTNTPANQDGGLQKGAPWPLPRFTKNGNGTVTDNLTGLIWLQNAGCTSFFPGDGSPSPIRTWEGALAAANSLASGSCGLTDGSTAGQWRLPNVKELQSLLDYEYAEPSLSNAEGTGRWVSGDPFTGVWAHWYWTSTSVSYSPGAAWYVELDVGGVWSLQKSIQLFVWPVRDGS